MDCDLYYPMANYDFKKDIVIGEEGENILIKDLIALGATFESNNKTNSHDIIVKYKDKEVTYECKTDIFSDTGNMFIETKSRGKESGISVTKAKWFVTYFKRLNELWYIETTELKKILSEYEHTYIKNVGDKDSNTEGYLLNKNMFRNSFIVRDSITHNRIITKWQRKQN